MRIRIKNYSNAVETIDAFEGVADLTYRDTQDIRPKDTLNLLITPDTTIRDLNQFVELLSIDEAEWELVL